MKKQICCLLIAFVIIVGFGSVNKVNPGTGGQITPLAGEVGVGGF